MFRCYAIASSADQRAAMLALERARENRFDSAVIPGLSGQSAEGAKNGKPQ